MLGEAFRVSDELAEHFDRLGISYYVGGSLASSLHGFVRSTQDVDFVADMRMEHAVPFVRAVEPRFYVSEDAVRDAIRLRDSFNVIHLELMLKVDVFVLKQHAHSRAEMDRAGPYALKGGGTLIIASAEDIILEKLDWYRLGGGVSERQWDDVLGVLKVRGPALDRAYLARWSSVRGLEDLLARAYEDAGLPP
jgi:hypothetical protein